MLCETLPILESPLKKPKHDEEETNPNSPRSGNSSDDDDGLEHIKDKNLIDEYRKYERQVNESNGFDIDFVPRAFRRILGSHIFPCNRGNSEEWELIQGCTDFSIAEYNRLMKAKSQLQLVRIEKANKLRSYNYCFYITFEAVDTVSNHSGTYQTKISCQIGKEYKEMLLIRRKGQKKGILFPVDLDDKEDYERIKKCTDFALSEYNEMEEGKSHLQLLQIVKAVQDTMKCRTYCIALEAMDNISRQTNTYYAVVIYALREMEYIAVQQLWPKGEKNHEFAEYEEDL